MELRRKRETTGSSWGKMKERAKASGRGRGKMQVYSLEEMQLGLLS